MSSHKQKSDRNMTAPGRGASPDEIARRAFELYAARGREDGHDVDDWLRAERELIGAAGTPKGNRSSH
jgi:Protein of unknown function (DUF2934)